jgi:hypothetical protein
LGIAVVLGFAHGPILRGLALPLVADEPAGDASFVCLGGTEYGVDGEGAFDWAAAWCGAAATRRVLLLEPQPSRPVEIHVIPSFAEIARRELAKRGLSPAAVASIPGETRDDWDEAYLLAVWLRNHPAARVVLFRSRFDSGKMRYMLHTVLGHLANRVQILAPIGRDGGESRWWRSRDGVKAFMFGWLDLAYTWGQGENRFVPRLVSTAEYQSMLQKTFGEAPR